MHVQILRTHFKVTCFLGLTATATQSTLESVCAHLGVPPEEGVVQGNVLPPNLELSVSNDRDKDAVSMAHQAGNVDTVLCITYTICVWVYVLMYTICVWVYVLMYCMCTLYVI